MATPIRSVFRSIRQRTSTRILSGFLLLCLVPGFLSFASAHPLDVSATSMTVSGNSASVTTALHPAQVEAVLWKRGIPMRTITYGDYYLHKDLIFEYLAKSVFFRTSSEDCLIGEFEARERSVDEIFSEGFPVSYSFSCPEEIARFATEIRIFEEVPLQTNRLSLIGKNGETLAYKVLTPVIAKFEHDFSAGQARGVDSDSDGLSDEEETAYRTDPNNPDTDGDNYLDGEEVYAGWNPLSKELSPGQGYREFPVDGNLSGGAGEGTFRPEAARYDPPVTLLDSSTYGADFFRKVLKSVAQFAEEPSGTGFWSLFFLTAALGFVHAAGPGHAKTLLASSVLDRRRGYLSWLAFALVFTVTHLADVAILVLLTKYVFDAFDPSPYMLAVQRFWAVGLLLLAGYLCYRAYVDWKSPPVRDFSADRFRALPGFRDVLAGFFAGLAPCAFGWGIFLVLFSLGKIAWAVPLLFALWLGIFACLLLVLTATYFLRERAFAFAPGIFRYSHVFSAAAISFVAVFMVFAVW